MRIRVGVSVHSNGHLMLQIDRTSTIGTDILVVS